MFTQGQKNNTPVSRNPGNKKKSSLGWPQKKKNYQLTESFKQSLHLKNYSNITFLCWKAKSPIFYCIKGKKHKFVQINLIVKFFCLSMSFFETKNMYSHTHSTFAAGVGDKKIFAWPISGNNTTFFGPMINFVHWQNTKYC